MTELGFVVVELDPVAQSRHRLHAHVVRQRLDRLQMIRLLLLLPCGERIDG